MKKIEIEIDYEPFENGLLGLTFTGRYDEKDVCGGICMIAPQAERKIIVDELGEIHAIGFDNSKEKTDG